MKDVVSIKVDLPIWVWRLDRERQSHTCDRQGQHLRKKFVLASQPSSHCRSAQAERQILEVLICHQSFESLVKLHALEMKKNGVDASSRHRSFSLFYCQPLYAKQFRRFHVGCIGWDHHEYRQTNESRNGIVASSPAYSWITPLILKRVAPFNGGVIHLFGSFDLTKWCLRKEPTILSSWLIDPKLKELSLGQRLRRELYRLAIGRSFDYIQTFGEFT